VVIDLQLQTSINWFILTFKHLTSDCENHPFCYYMTSSTLKKMLIGGQTIRGDLRALGDCFQLVPYTMNQTFLAKT